METQFTIKNWLKKENTLSNLQVKRISFDESKEWRWNEDGFLTHFTNRFFRVTGVKYFSVTHGDFRTQPIIDQPEIGLLSFLVFKDDQTWWILAHAKVEPGNVNETQLAPTVQATKSNYEVAHGGSATPYLNIVQSAGQPLYNQLQSEQNSRFLAKRNRNSVILLKEKIDERQSYFKWMPIREFLPMLGESHTVNTDARSVLTCWLFTDVSALRGCLPSNIFTTLLIESIESQNALHQSDCLNDWLDGLNKKYFKKKETISLKNLDASWNCTDSQIFSPDDPSLLIYHIAVSCQTREVTHWDQPIAGSQSQSLIILIVRSFQGTLHLLLQAKLEAGNRNGFELTTTVQTDLSYITPDEGKYIDMAEKSGKKLLCFDNSEEGGRFDQCISRYQIVWIDEVSQPQEAPFHRWVSLFQVSDFLKNENLITNELRSAMSGLLSIRQL